MSGSTAAMVTRWRQNTKKKLVEAHGGHCFDCHLEFPPFMFDFDHRDPSTKSFNVSNGQSTAYEKQLAESLKCDMVCANCHRMRTHIQRCAGCEYCENVPFRKVWDARA